MKNFVNSQVFWLGHDGFRLVGSKTVYIDPFKISGGPKADIIMFTHPHDDHCSPEDAAKVQTTNTLFIGPADALQKIDGKNKRIVKPQDKFTEGDISFEVVPAYNINKNFHPKSNNWVGYIITIADKRIYHAGDTDHIPEMKNFKTDIALLPVSGTYVMTADEAVNAALDIKPAIAIPMHYGTIIGEMSDAEKFKSGLTGKIETLILAKV